MSFRFWSDSEKHGSIEVDKCSWQALEWWCIRGELMGLRAASYRIVCMIFMPILCQLILIIETLLFIVSMQITRHVNCPFGSFYLTSVIWFHFLSWTSWNISMFSMVKNIETLCDKKIWYHLSSSEFHLPKIMQWIVVL